MGWIKVMDDIVRWDSPKELVGEYLGAEMRQTKLGASRLHRIKNGHGGATGFFGTKILDARLAAIAPGTKVRIEYIGEASTQQGTRYKRFDVSVDDGGDKAV